MELGSPIRDDEPAGLLGPRRTGLRTLVRRNQRSTDSGPNGFCDGADRCVDAGALAAAHTLGAGEELLLILECRYRGARLRRLRVCANQTVFMISPAAPEGSTCGTDVWPLNGNLTMNVVPFSGSL